MLIQLGKKISGTELFEAIKKIPDILNAGTEKWSVRYFNGWHATKDGFELNEIRLLRLEKEIKTKFLLIFPVSKQVSFHFPNIKMKKIYASVYIDIADYESFCHFD